MGSHVLHYEAPAKNWNEALPLGNGRIGAMLYGRVEKEIISMNEDTIWSGYPKIPVKEGAKEAYQKAKELCLAGKNKEAQELLEKDFNCCWTQAYLPLCDIFLESGETKEVTDYERRLDCAQALYTNTYRSACGAVTKECFISAPDQVMVYRVSGGEGKVRISLRSPLRHTIYTKDGVLYLEGECPSDMGCEIDTYPGAAYEYAKEPEKRGVRFLAAIAIKHTGGTLTQENEAISLKGASEYELYFTVHTSFAGFDKSPYLEGREYKAACEKTLSAALLKGYEAIKAAHVADFKAYYNRTDFTLEGIHKEELPTDARLQAFCEDKSDVGLYELIFNFGKYLLISASREGTQAMNLQGIWNDNPTPPWNCNYTVNINTQMNYWCAPLLGLSELQEPLLALVKAMAVTGKETAKHFFGAGGFTAFHNSDLWAHTVPVRGSASWSYFPFASGWLCNNLFRAYEYTGNREYLQKELFPLLKEAARFYSDILIEDTDGHLIVCPQTSPENTFYKDGVEVAVAKYAAMGMTIVREVFTNCIAAAERLGKEDAFIEKLRVQLKRLMPLKIGSKGQLLEWDEEYEEVDPHHRHVSHLYALHPAELIRKEQDAELAKACSTTLKLRGDDGTGWSLGWKINFHARLGNGDAALRLLQRQLFPAVDKNGQAVGSGTYPNLFDAHPPFQIDGNFAAVSGIYEMLVRSTEEEISLLPALPKAWQAGKVTGFAVKGGAVVDFSWRNGRVEEYSLHGTTKQYIIHMDKE